MTFQFEICVATKLHIFTTQSWQQMDETAQVKASNRQTNRKRGILSEFE